MDKIIHLPGQSTLIGTLESILKEAKAGTINKFVFAAELNTNEVLTAYSNCNFSDKQKLMSDIQIDIVKQMIDANY